MKLSDVDDVGASEEQSDSAGRFQINSVRSRRQSTVRFVEEDNVSRKSLVKFIFKTKPTPAHKTLSGKSSIENGFELYLSQQNF